MLSIAYATRCLRSPQRLSAGRSKQLPSCCGNSDQDYLRVAPTWDGYPLTISFGPMSKM
jgi:hypothetical protein